MKHPFHIYTNCADGRILFAIGDARTVELCREACHNIEVEDAPPLVDVAPEAVLRLKANLDYTKAISDYHGAF